VSGPVSGPPTGLRVGLGQLRDIRKPFVDALLAERARGGPFAGFHDFVRRTDPRLVDLRALIRSAASIPWPTAAPGRSCSSGS